MNYEQKLKLAKKYFWQQKAKEVLKFILIIGIIASCIYLVYLISKPIGTWACSTVHRKPSTCNESIRESGIIMIVLILLILVLFCLAIYQWLTENWERAKRRAGLK